MQLEEHSCRESSDPTLDGLKNHELTAGQIYNALNQLLILKRILWVLLVVERSSQDAFIYLASFITINLVMSQLRLSQRHLKLFYLHWFGCSDFLCNGLMNFKQFLKQKTKIRRKPS